MILCYPARPDRGRKDAGRISRAGETPVPVSAAFSDTLALAFFVDLLLSTFILAWPFARKPIGPVRWPWFVALSLLGTLAFSIPLYVWLNWRLAPAPRPHFDAWLRGIQLSRPDAGAGVTSSPSNRTGT